MKRIAWVLAWAGIAVGTARAADAIDREALVRRHEMTVERISGNEVLQTGNGAGRSTDGSWKMKREGAQLSK